MKIAQRVLLITVLGALFAACNPIVAPAPETEDNGALQISVGVQDPGPEGSRTLLNTGYATTFTTGDVIGITVVGGGGVSSPVRRT